MNAFEVLGIDPASATRAAVRRAYAAALRLHRPEDDPQGFRRVRDAYEALSGLDDAGLAERARWESSSADYDEYDDDDSVAVTSVEPTLATADEAPGPEPASATADEAEPFDDRATGERTAPPPSEAAPPAAPTRPSSIADEWRRRVAAASIAARAPGARVALRGPWTALASLALESRELAAFERALLELGEPAAADAAQSLPAAVLVALLRAGLDGLAGSAVDRWVQEERWGPLVGLAHRVAGTRPPLAPPAPAHFLARLGELVVVLDAAAAATLAETAYRVASPRDRRTLSLDTIDRRLAAGRALEGETDVVRRTLATLLARGRWSPKDDVPGVEDVIAALEQGIGDDDAVFAMVAERLPRLTGEVAARRQRRSRRLASVRDREGARARLGKAMLYVLAAFIILPLLAWYVSARLEPKVPSRPERSYEHFREMMEERRRSSDEHGASLLKKREDEQRFAELEWRVVIRVPLTDAEQRELDALRARRDAATKRAAESAAVEISPLHAAAYFNRGLEKDTRGDSAGALSDYTRAIEIDPSHAPAYSGRGAVRKTKGDIDGALSDYTRAIEINPHDATPYSGRGRVKWNARDFVGAAADFRKALDLDPGSDYTRFFLFLALALGPEGEAAASAALEKGLATRGAPIESGAWVETVGRLLRGRITAEEIVKAAEASPVATRTENLCEAHFYSGVLAWIRGDKARATTLLERAVATLIGNCAEYAAARAVLKWAK